MKKNKKILYSLGAITTIAIPVIAVVSCGKTSSGYANLGIKTSKVNGTSDGMNKVVSEDLSIFGSWGDSRFYANKNKDKIHVVGIQRKRISNDGIQVRGNMNPNDQKAIQNLFKDLIKLAVAQKKSSSKSKNDSLLLEGKNGKLISVFDVYSHTGYKELKGNDTIGILKGKKIENSKAIRTGSGPSNSFSARSAEIFSTATPSTSTFTNITDLKANYKTKKTLTITFIPSNDPSLVTRATKKLTTYLKSIGVDARINASTDYDTAGASLNNDQVDVAFLPAGTWNETAEKSNFILQAARPVQVATIDVTGTVAKLPGAILSSEFNAVNLFNKYGQLYLRDVTTTKLNSASLKTQQKEFKEAAKVQGSAEYKIKELANKTTGQDLLTGQYESWLFTKKGSALDKILYPKAQEKKAWTLPFSKVKDLIKYGYTSTTSSASYEFPEIWFAEHFTK